MSHWVLGVLLLLLTQIGGITSDIYTSQAVVSSDQQGIEFNIISNNGTYEVYFRPNITPATPNLTLTAQVTIKAPHSVGSNRFTLTNIKSGVTGTSWQATSRIDAPSEDPQADYISFELSFPGGNYAAFNWQADQEVKVFTFQNKGTCLGPVTLLTNDDPFMPPNSMSTNPGDQITVMGLANDNGYIGNYGPNLAECVAATPTSTPTATALSGPTAAPTATPIATPTIVPTAPAPKPTTLISFNAGWQANKIVTQWETSSESNISGFILYRSSDNDRTHAVLVTTQMIASQGSLGGIYTFNDLDVSYGITYTYWLEAVTTDGESSQEAITTISLNQPIFLPLVSHQ
jgi:hypothetical protein